MHKNRFYYLTEGTRFLTNRLGVVILISILGMSLLSRPYVWDGLSQQFSDMFREELSRYHGCSHWRSNAFLKLVGLVFLSPLWAYIIPRFLAHADAQTGDNPLNIKNEWSLRFKERWLPFLGSNILFHFLFFLYQPITGTVFGAFNFNIKHSVMSSMTKYILVVIVEMIFNLVSLSILLRGESILQATKSGLEIMRRAWLKILIAVTVISTISFTANYIIIFFVDFFIKGLTTQQLLQVQPAILISHFLQIIGTLWVSACLLSLYRETKNRVLSQKINFYTISSVR